ncbi:MAG: S-layer homology domain-containing protein [Patescibacteria group bacterium]
MHNSFWREHQHFLKGLIATIAITAVLGIFQEQAFEFMAEVLEFEKPAPFDGTSLPVKEIPDWSNINSSEFNLLAAQLPQEKKIELPNYDPIIFGTVVADLNFGIDKDLANKLITYAVPYMGSYETGSREYDGSHLGVDIKVPTGTPIRVIANGKVVKVAEASAGFGKHVVVKHYDVPLLNKNETVDLYSAYAHLSRLSVIKGQILTRGTVVGFSGTSGTSTTPHLHFQIDNENAPWHPWWPFSSKEASAQGLDFFDGVSAGLGQAEAIENTINPMLWTQRYLTADLVEIPKDLHAAASSQSPATSETEVEAVAETEEPEDLAEPEEENQEPEEENQEPKEALFSDVAGDHPNYKAIKYLKEKEIIGGYPDGTFQPDKTVSRVEALKMILLGFDIDVVPVLDLGFPDTSNQQWYAPFVGTAIKRDIAKGYPDGTFGPGKTVNRAEYLKILLASAGINPDSAAGAPYTDVPIDAWFASFAAYSKLKNIFPAVGDVLNAGNGVTRAEVAETIYRMIVLQKTDAESYTQDLEI